MKQFQIVHVTYVILTETDFVYLIRCFFCSKADWPSFFTVHVSMGSQACAEDEETEYDSERVQMYTYHYFQTPASLLLSSLLTQRVYCLTVPQNGTFTRAKQVLISPSQLFVWTKLLKGTRELWKREIDQIDVLFLLDPWQKISPLRIGEETDVVNTFIHSFSIFLIISEKVD